MLSSSRLSLSLSSGFTHCENNYVNCFFHHVYKKGICSNNVRGEKFIMILLEHCLLETTKVYVSLQVGMIMMTGNGLPIITLVVVGFDYYVDCAMCKHSAVTLSYNNKIGNKQK